MGIAHTTSYSVNQKSRKWHHSQIKKGELGLIPITVWHGHIRRITMDLQEVKPTVGEKIIRQFSTRTSFSYQLVKILELHILAQKLWCSSPLIILCVLVPLPINIASLWSLFLSAFSFLQVTPYISMTTERVPSIIWILHFRVL